MSKQTITAAAGCSSFQRNSLSPVRLLLCLLLGLAGNCLLQSSGHAALVTGIKAYYDFNQSSGTTLPLVIGTGSSGVLNNMDNSDWVAGKPGYGNALDFDGSNDYVHIAGGYTNTISGDDTHSFSMWFKPDAVSNKVLIDAEDTSSALGYFFQLDPTLKGYLGFGGTYRTYTGTPITASTWHHLGYTKTGAGNSGDLYLDGSLLGTYTGTFGSTSSESSDLLVGKYRSGSFNFDGQIDDLAFWDRVLTTDEFALLYSGGMDLGSLITLQALAGIPEPSSLLIFGLGSLALVRHTRRRNQRA